MKKLLPNLIFVLAAFFIAFTAHVMEAEGGHTQGKDYGIESTDNNASQKNPIYDDRHISITEYDPNNHKIEIVLKEEAQVFFCQEIDPRRPRAC